ncbi:MAG: hypothetical protein Q4E34_03560 [Synergistaceae bacterium]|nr:hypothetical protein [Synergistaceae bacterium]
MSIAVAIQRGSSVYVYDESNRVLYTKTGELHGYTSTTVNVRQGSTIYTYDERGSVKFTHSA